MIWRDYLRTKTTEDDEIFENKTNDQRCAKAI